MIQKKLDCISEVLEIEVTVADLSRSLRELEEWDSIGVLGLMAKADEEFGVTLTPKALEAAQTIQDLIELLEVTDGK